MFHKKRRFFQEMKKLIYYMNKKRDYTQNRFSIIFIQQTINNMNRLYTEKECMEKYHYIEAYEHDNLYHYGENSTETYEYNDDIDEDLAIELVAVLLKVHHEILYMGKKDSPYEIKQATLDLIKDNIPNHIKEMIKYYRE